MCHIEFIVFNVNGLVNIPNCIAKETDTITIDIGVRFGSSEIGSWRAWVAVSYNNGEEEYYSATKNISSGINDFIVSIPLRVGTIKVTEVSINNPITQCVIKENPTMSNCQTLTVSASVTNSINFVSNPSGAEIILNNSDQQHITPYTITEVPVGTYSYRLTLPNHPDITGNVTVQANQIAQVSVDFTTGQINTGALLVGVGITAVLMGGIIYYVTRNPDTTSIIVR